MEKNVYSFSTPCVLINLGTMDIAAGRELTAIQGDMLRLTNALLRRNIVPIVCTLPNIQIESCGERESMDIYRKTLLFNNYLVEALPHNVYTVDLWLNMVDKKRKTLYCYYQS